MNDKLTSKAKGDLDGVIDEEKSTFVDKILNPVRTNIIPKLPEFKMDKIQQFVSDPLKVFRENPEEDEPEDPDETEESIEPVAKVN